MSPSATIGVHHIGLAVPFLDDAVNFFTEALGWQLVSRNPDYPSAFVNDGTVTVTLWQIPLRNLAVPFDRKRNIGLHHLAFAVKDLESLNKAFEQVKAYPRVSIEFGPTQMSPTSKRYHFMCAMPGGIRIEFAMRADS